MQQKTTARILLISGVIILFSYLVFPTIKLSSMDVKAKQLMQENDPQRYEKLLKKSIKLGLDLQGGMHIVLEVDVKELLNKLAQNKDQRFEKALSTVTEMAADDDIDFINALDQKLAELGTDITAYYGSRDLKGRDAILKYLHAQESESLKRTLEILRNRVDQFGVAEPSIQKQGNRRLIIELAGITDRERALELIGKTAKLEFRLLKEPQMTQKVANKINEYLLAQNKDSTALAAGNESSEAPKEDDESQETVSAKDLFGNTTVSESNSSATDTTDLASIENEMEPLLLISPQGLLIQAIHLERLQKLLKKPEIQKMIEQESGDAQFLIGKLPQDSRNDAPREKLIPVYLLNTHSELTGETILKASHRPGSTDDLNAVGSWEVHLTLNDKGTREFARVTGANVNKPLAIILDERVQSAPNISVKIRDGRARITGINSSEEAKDLAIVLRAGALPAPSRIIEERTVGPSLGRDSVEKGYKSALWGLALVAIFMIVYYRFSGLLADIALVLNVLILMGFMAAMHATLTLPGIAGIILTIGMAVDANVLIFERIREEIDRGKSISNSLDTGYSRAFVTILDANITTFIVAVVLYNFGSGPIRGFATTLMLGILASMFTAIFVTRTLFEFLLSKKILKQISI